MGVGVLLLMTLKKKSISTVDKDHALVQDGLGDGRKRVDVIPGQDVLPVLVVVGTVINRTIP